MANPSPTVWTEQFKHPVSFLEKEDGGYLLLETGDKIVLEQTGTDPNLWTNQTLH